MAELKTLNDILLRVAASGNPRAVLWRDPAAVWHPISGSELFDRVHRLAAVLDHWGIYRGDRVGIISENRWEWPVVDFAALALGAVDVPIYPTLNGEQSAFMLRDSGTRVLFVSTRKQFEKIAPLRDTTHLERIIVMDDEPVPGAQSFRDLLQSPPAQLTQEAFRQRLASVAPDDLATIIYTSGTTGVSKGVELTHGNIASNIQPSTGMLEWTPTHTCISFLPLSHVTARMLDYSLYTFNATVAHCPQFDLLPQAIQEVKPSFFVSVPRVYEKIRQAVEQKAGSSAIKKRLFTWAVATGRKNRSYILAGKTPPSLAWKLAHKLVLAKIAGAFGGNLRYAISGGAPLGLATAEWFADAGIRILEGYGLTETSPVISLNIPQAHRIGSVGKPLVNVECRIAEDGELLVRGPNVFRGYWKNAEATREVFTPDGFFHTGDIGRIDEDGFLYITDRKKELLKTSGGKLIAPQPIEGKLKANLLVAEAALVGDRHKFASVLICPNFPALEAWAAGQGIAFSSRAALVADPRVQAEYQAIVDRVNLTLSNFETMKRVTVVPDEWSLESGELTPSLKLKRRVINERYATQIAALYADEAYATRS